jgi:hypothetical protein
VHSTATLDYYGDVIYSSQRTILWALGQQLAVLAVFCVPSFPKAFGSCGLLKHAKEQSSNAKLHSALSSGPYQKMSKDIGTVPTDITLIDVERR